MHNIESSCSTVKMQSLHSVFAMFKFSHSGRMLLYTYVYVLWMLAGKQIHTYVHTLHHSAIMMRIQMRNVKSRLPPTVGCTNQCKYSEVETEVHIRTHACTQTLHEYLQLQLISKYVMTCKVPNTSTRNHNVQNHQVSLSYKYPNTLTLCILVPSTVFIA